MDNEKKVEAPEVDTPQPKSMIDSILEAAEASAPVEEVKEEAKTEEVKAEVKDNSKLEETLKNLLQGEEDEVKKMRDLLPNTKDESKKLEMERAIFEKEKKIDSLKNGLGTTEVIDLSEANAVLEELKIDKSGETYKLIERMKGMPKGGSDLIKMFTRIAKAISLDSAKPVEPISIEDKPKDTGGSIPKEDNSIVGQIARSLKQ